MQNQQITHGQLARNQKGCVMKFQEILLHHIKFL